MCLFDPLLRMNYFNQSSKACIEPIVGEFIHPSIQKIFQDMKEIKDASASRLDQASNN